MVITPKHILPQKSAVLVLFLAGFSMMMLSGCDTSARRINELQQQVWQDPDNPEAYIRLAHARASQQQYDEAIESYQKALSLDPESGERVYPALGAIAFNRERYTEALGFFRKSLELSPRDSLRLYDIGNTYMNLEKYPEAAEAYRQAIENSVAFEEAHYNLAIAYIRSGRMAEAREIYSWLEEKNNYLAVSLERHLYPENKTPDKNNENQ
ncbi:tetratricopeptide repeat protein [Prosthecochloris sp. N3]|uniref:Tetratricopeptide repeat protein n=1 Tax=Prosthecochloris ethylica TaxID=2743976 RepID=A0ABR9XNL9_9CHLB|nr:tetratricopeptide repeat protein [Prosthecochloris ethylica]MBF0585699.1 tetratricopeptide repeat protein [Prosthecochloris ethylica]MBF0635609.1 tetratricopeptide repeat protein [Prosthecochloris ethylica]NUK46908.1 tetratricopeptide repeat protein [Prosthecochloris ethylica]